MAADTRRFERSFIHSHADVFFAPSQLYNELEWEESIIAAERDRYEMPAPGLFIPYLIRVRDAAAGKRYLVTRENKQLPQRESDNVYNALFTPKPKSLKIWTWLNTKFVDGSGYLGLDIERHFQNDDDQKEVIALHSSPLEECLNESCFADLDSFNEQGMATRKSNQQEYVPGKNIFVWKPMAGCVSIFRATSVGQKIHYDADPRDQIPNLGVLACIRASQRIR